MKHALRPRYALLLFLLLAATLGFWVVFDRSRCFQMKFVAPISRASPEVVFNKTLLDFAAIEAGEARLKQEIEDLMEWNYFSRGRQRSFLASGRTDLRLKVRGIRGIPLQLRSPEFYRLWLSFRRYLGDWSRNRRFRSDALSDLVTEIKLLIDNHNGIKVNSTGKYKTCAVVGNSGILLNHDYGKIIDSHDIVIRLNNARTQGFERNVGAKTSISFVNSNILHLCARRAGCSCHPYGDHIPLVMYICQPAHFFDFLICNSSLRAPLIITDPRFDVMCSRIVKYYSVKRFVAVSGKDPGEWATVHDLNFHYSSGMQAVMMAVGVCEEVSIFGYGKSVSARHHYHTHQKAELSLHDYEAEYDFYEDLMKKPQAIPFVSDKFKLPSVTIHR